MVTPLLVMVVPALGLSPTVEWLFLVVSIVVGTFALQLGTRIHRRRGSWGIAAVGACMWTLSLLGVFEPIPETLTSAAGGLAVAAALFWNGRLIHRHACNACDCPLH